MHFGVSLKILEKNYGYAYEPKSLFDPDLILT